MPEAPPLADLFGGPEQRLAWRRYWLRDTAVGLFDTAMHRLLGLAGVDGCSAAGAWLGPVIGPLKAGRGERLVQNLRFFRPGASEAEIRAAARRTWANIGRSIAEFSVLPRIWKSDRISIEGLEHVRGAVASGRPRVYLALHLGNWEMVGPKLLAEGENGTEFYQPPKNRFKRRIADRMRLQFEGQLIPPGPKGAQQAFRILKDEKGGVVFFMDEFWQGRVWGPAFGRPLRTDGNLAKAVKMATLTGALLLPAWCERLHGARFRVHVLPPVPLKTGGEKAADLAANVAMLDAWGEAVVRRQAEQWFMLPELRLDR